MITDEDKQLELALANLDRQYGKGTVFRPGGEVEPWPAVSTGALTLDLALGIQGLPKGRIVEIYGPESSGKSTLCLSVVAQIQKEGGRALYIDAEHALDPVYCKALGVNLDDLLLAQPATGEEAIDIAEKLVRTGSVAVVVVDSVAALVPKAELEGDMGDQHMGLQPRLMSKAMRKLNGAASETGTLVIFVNQLREKIGIVFGNPEVTPGGKALRYYSSVRIDIRRKEDIKAKEDGSFIGVATKAKIVKNKMAPPFKIAEFDIMFGRGIDNLGCLVDLAVDKGIMTKSGAWYSYGDEKNVAQGRDNAKAWLASDLDLADKFREWIINGTGA